MRNALLSSAAAVAAMLWTVSANAVPIAAGSELSTNGSDTFTASTTAFSIQFLGLGNIGGTSGDFATAIGVVPPQLTGVVTFTNFTDASANFQLYTATANGETTTLVAANISSFLFTPPSPTLESLDVKGTGTLTLTGTGGNFDPTPGTWELTTQGPGGAFQVTFSETGVTAGVPEPASLGIFAMALLAMGWVVKRHNQR